MKKLVAMAIIILSLAIGQVWAADQTADFIVTKTGSGQILEYPFSILSINLRGTTAGDNIGIYDWRSANNDGTGIGDIRDLEFEFGISANNSSVPFDAKGIKFRYGVYVQSSATTNFTTILFDY